MKRSKRQLIQEKMHEQLTTKEKFFSKTHLSVVAFLGFLSMLTLFITPWIIPPDGSLYLTSARSIFTQDMGFLF
jgi:hypothetical protein